MKSRPPAHYTRVCIVCEILWYIVVISCKEYRAGNAKLLTQQQQVQLNFTGHPRLWSGSTDYTTIDLNCCKV